MNEKPEIAFLTAGAAGMYCGSCMHDNSLARALMANGWNVQLIPTYTPIRTDEKDVTIDHVYFGGINLYLQQRIPIFRHVPAMLDRMFDNPWLIRRLTAKASETSPKFLGKLTVSMLKGIHGNQRKEVRRLVKWLKTAVKPDALLLTNMLIAGFVPFLKQELNVPVIVMLQGDDIFLESLPDPYQQQAVVEIRRLAKHIDAFVFHSRFYADKMNDWFTLDANKTYITPLAIDTADFQREVTPADEKNQDQRALPTIDPGKTKIGYLARIAPEKGLHVLVDAFIDLKQTEAGKNAHLMIAGWLGDHHRSYADEQKQKLTNAGLQNDFDFLGTIDRSTKIKFLQSLDLFSVPTTYQEPKGIFVLEAMACGIPVLQPNHGAFPEVIESTRGGWLFDPENVEDLSRKLQQLIVDEEARQQLGAAGRSSVIRDRDFNAMAADAARVFDEILSSPGG